MAVLDRVPIDRITEQAREVHFGRALLTLLAGLFFVIGWTLRAVWFALVWAFTAARVGWNEGPGSPVRHREGG